MAICSYCNKDKSLTHEHIIPDWYLKIDPSPEDEGFLERIPHRFLTTDIVIKDVCADCNNLHLSKLDSYGKLLYESYFAEHIYKGENVEFKYDYNILIKWLIKMSYNSARIHKTDLEILNSYAHILISETSLPESVFVYCDTIAPSYQNHQGELEIASRNCSEEITKPEWFRVGVFRVPKFDSINWAFRHVSINSYAFYIFIPRVNSKEAVVEKEELVSAIKSARQYGVLLNKASSTTKLNEPILDATTFLGGHIVQFPISYGLINDDITKQFIKKEFGTMLYLIDRLDIETRNTENILSVLRHLMSCREIALAYMQKVEFAVDGYDDDHRELYEIEEVVSFLKEVDRQFPFWMFFQSEYGVWLKILALCLSDGKNIRKGEVCFNAKKMGALIERWFVKLNELCHRCAISEKINRKVSETCISLIASRGNRGMPY